MQPEPNDETKQTSRGSRASASCRLGRRGNEASDHERILAMSLHGAEDKLRCERREADRERYGHL